MFSATSKKSFVGFIYAFFFCSVIMDFNLFVVVVVNNNGVIYFDVYVNSNVFFDNGLLFDVAYVNNVVKIGVAYGDVVSVNIVFVMYVCSIGDICIDFGLKFVLNDGKFILMMFNRFNFMATASVVVVVGNSLFKFCLYVVLKFVVIIFNVVSVFVNFLVNVMFVMCIVFVCFFVFGVSFASSSSSYSLMYLIVSGNMFSVYGDSDVNIFVVRMVMYVVVLMVLLLRMLVLIVVLRDCVVL